MSPNTEVFLRRLRPCGKSTSEQRVMGSKKNIVGNHVLFKDNEAIIILKALKDIPMYGIFFSKCMLNYH